jgi:hypothetical protein
MKRADAAILAAMIVWATGFALATIHAEPDAHRIECREVMPTGGLPKLGTSIACRTMRRDRSRARAWPHSPACLLRFSRFPVSFGTQPDKT